MTKPDEMTWGVEVIGSWGKASEVTKNPCKDLEIHEYDAYDEMEKLWDNRPNAPTTKCELKQVLTVIALDGRRTEYPNATHFTSYPYTGTLIIGQNEFNIALYNMSQIQSCSWRDVWK